MRDRTAVVNRQQGDRPAVLSPDRSRLAIVRSRDGGAVLETLVGLDGSWQLARRLDLRGDGPRAIAWTR